MIKYIRDDFVALRSRPEKKAFEEVQLVFGDKVEVLGVQGSWTQLRTLSRGNGRNTGWAYLDPDTDLMDDGVFSFSMVDVQQGDGLVMETPSGKIVLIDGGDNKLFARHLAWRYFHRASSEDNPLEVEAIIITHGDADHFDGLNDIRRSETERHLEDRQRLFLAPKRIFHNGLVKMPSKTPDGRSRADKDMFGEQATQDGVLYATELHDDFTALPDSQMNLPFQRWKETIEHWRTRAPVEVRRVAYGDDPSDLFSFLFEEDIAVSLQGPFTETVSGKPALRFFRAPAKSAEMHLKTKEGAYSDSHTINGHSIAMLISYGNVRINLTGDLNRPAMKLALEKLAPGDLEAEIVKAPHHGSGDFDLEALKAMRPVVGIVSSGDESAAKEHIHPRATLMAALGKVMRLDTGIIFSTELAAFFTVKDYAHTREDLAKHFGDRKDETFTGADLKRMFTGRPEAGEPFPFFSFHRSNYGIIHMRTDGQRVLVFTHSGERHVNEAYSFEVKMDEHGARTVEFHDEVSVR